MNGLMFEEFMGRRIVVTDSCCERVPARHHKKRRLKKKWIKKYGYKFIPYNKIVLVDNIFFIHPKYWEKIMPYLRQRD